jgi:hypothetical protein
MGWEGGLEIERTGAVVKGRERGWTVEGMEVESGEGDEGSRGVRRGVRENEGRTKA